MTGWAACLLLLVSAATCRNGEPPPGDPVVEADGVKVTVSAGGGIQVQVEDKTYSLESAFSYPRTPKIGYNQWLARPQSPGEPNWLPRARRLNGRTLEVTAEGQFYRLTRTATLQDGRIELADHIENRTDQVVGVLLRHELRAPQAPTTWRLGGLERTVVSERTMPENPTVYFADGDTGVGAVMQDSLLRLQMGSLLKDNVIRLDFRHFALAPRAERTLRWALYPLPTSGLKGPPDYFSFINAVRRDWNVNFTVQGPLDFVDARRVVGAEGAAFLKEIVERKRLRIFLMTPWFEFYHSLNVTRDQYKALMQRAMQAIRKARPDALCLGVVESNLMPVPFTLFGDTLPADLPYGRPGTKTNFGKQPGKFGLSASRAMTERIETLLLSDSVIRDRDGNALLDTNYVDYYEDKHLNLMVYPTLENTWHRQVLDKIRFLLDDVGLDGVYFDSFSYSSVLTDHFSHDQWDGWTVDIDEQTGEVIRRYADLGLRTSAARRQWVEEVRKRGKIVVANSMPAVTEEQALPIFRFMETWYDPMQGDIPDAASCAKGHLASPIALGHQWDATAQKFGAPYFMRTVVAHLRYGLLYYYYLSIHALPSDGEIGGEYGPVPQMFPTTPVALGEGFLVGKERIVTCVSRAFNWQTSQRPVARFYDERGRSFTPGDDQFQVAPGSNGVWRVTVKLRDWREVAVVE